MTDYIITQIVELRIAHPETCWRPNYKLTRVCVLPLGHRFTCGWENDEDDSDTPNTSQQDTDTQRRKGTSADLHKLWTQPTLPLPYPDILQGFTSSLRGYR